LSRSRVGDSLILGLIFGHITLWLSPNDCVTYGQLPDRTFCDHATTEHPQYWPSRRVMTMQGNDPRGDYSAGATNPETSLTTVGGVLEVVVIVSVA
jgi:hypothetical protein